MITTEGLEHLLEKHSDVVTHVMTERARVEIEIVRAGGRWRSVERVLVHLIWAGVLGYVIWMAKELM